MGDLLQSKFPNMKIQITKIVMNTKLSSCKQINYEQINKYEYEYEIWIDEQINIWINE